MARLRLGRKEPTRQEMVWILWAVQELAIDAVVRMEELFNLDPQDPMNWPNVPILAR